FHQFMERAAAAGLRYLGEARVRTMAAFQTEGMRGRLRQFSADPLEQEQYHDFLRNRFFRQTLLCRAERTPDPRPSLDRLKDLWVVGRAAPVSVIFDYYSPAPVRFPMPDHTQEVIDD